MFGINLKQAIYTASIVLSVVVFMFRNYIRQGQIDKNAVLFDRYLDGDDSALQDLNGIYKDIANLSKGFLTQENPSLNNAEFRLHPLFLQVAMIHENSLPETTLKKYMAPVVNLNPTTVNSKGVANFELIGACEDSQLAQVIESGTCTKSEL